MSGFLGKYALFSITNKYPALDFILHFLRLPSYIMKVKLNRSGEMTLNNIMYVSVTYLLRGLLRLIIVISVFDYVVYPLFIAFYGEAPFPNIVKVLLLFICNTRTEDFIQKCI